MRLAKKVAIITGAGSGIGRASALLFAKEGAKVVVACRNDALGQETVAAIKADGGEAIFVHTDVTVASEVEHLVNATKNAFGKVDILFNNAGIRMESTPVENIDESSWDRVYSVNVKGVFLGAKYVVPEMKKAGAGVIINTASMGGVRPVKGSSAYGSSKGAVIALTKSLALELAPHIRVNCINPGKTDTPMVAGVGDSQTTLSKIPLKRIAKPEDTAYAALYLASDESSMLTGIAINVDGGRHL